MRTVEEVKGLIAAGTVGSVLEAFRWCLKHPAYEESLDVQALFRQAVEALAELADPSALEELIELLGDVTSHEQPPPRVELVVEALGALGDPQALGALCTCLESPYGHVREAAARALGELGAPEAIPVLEHVRACDGWERATNTTQIEYPVRIAAEAALRKLRALASQRHP